MVAGVWDVGLWDADRWGAVHKPPGAGWGEDWRFWFQEGELDRVDLSHLVVEARWTTDSYTMGDGTFRGDIQPGRLALRLWDPDRVAEGLNPAGSIWATYKPTGVTWCWYYHDLTRALYAAGDAQAADAVLTGDSWAAGMTGGVADDLTRPVESATARLEAIAGLMGAGVLTELPPIRTACAAQSQTVPATALDAQTGQWPSYLAVIREAAANGVAYWRADRATIGGELTLVYDRWETSSERALAAAQVIAGPPVTRGVEFVIGAVAWSAVAGATGATTEAKQTWPSPYGSPALGTMRLLGDVATGPEHGPAQATGTAIWADHTDPTERYLSTITCQSGDRLGPAGGPASSEWDPTAHVWTPAEVMAYTDDQGGLYRYRVTKSDHVLNARSWVTTHTLAKYTAPTPLPA